MGTLSFVPQVNRCYTFKAVQTREVKRAAQKRQVSVRNYYFVIRNEHGYISPEFPEGVF